jgi:hypothetical protein
MAERVKSAMGGAKKHPKTPKSKKKSKVHEMHIRHAANGGYIVKHDMEKSNADMPGDNSEEHQIGDMAELQQHVGDNMQQPGQEAAAAAPAPAAAMPAPQAA